MTNILALLMLTWSPDACTAPELSPYYEAGRAAGASYVAAVVHQPVDCDLLASNVDGLVSMANHEIALASRYQSIPTRACAFYGVGEAMLEAVAAAQMECGGSRDS